MTVSRYASLGSKNPRSPSESIVSTVSMYSYRPRDGYGPRPFIGRPAIVYFVFSQVSRSPKKAGGRYTSMIQRSRRAGCLYTGVSSHLTWSFDQTMRKRASPYMFVPPMRIRCFWRWSGIFMKKILDLMKFVIYSGHEKVHALFAM